MVYLSMLMALEDDSVFLEALQRGGSNVGVEFFSFRYDTEEMPRLRETLKLFSGHPITFHGPMRSAELTAEQNSAAWQSTLTAYKNALELAQEAGADSMVAHTHERYIPEEEKKQLMLRCEENLHALSEIAKPYGVTLCVENVSLPGKGAQLFDENEYIALIHRLPQCKSLIDVGHVNCTAWHMDKLCRELGNRISGFHMHNNDGSCDSHNWLSEGTFQVHEARKIIAMYSNQADYVLEYAQTTGKSANDLLDDVRLLRQNPFR